VGWFGNPSYVAAVAAEVLFVGVPTFFVGRIGNPSYGEFASAGRLTGYEPVVELLRSSLATVLPCWRIIKDYARATR
jgi:hypothetical protein